ncbi:uncharacterized protein PGRI_034150 [Penicillium griseofulvum]|uniref:Uncharacterized protein n=1 Tax=Penicillium patulum TaxID=5078 RepID=A0A135L9I7_PENPA|nr:uncharacterized protein PGRI_034150 [Penicillium griseofulvum]KXG45648.1 hypothetical protein PGRI_034150 [Penicillium griseofulvum]
MSSKSPESPGSPGVPARMVHPDSKVIFTQGTWLPEEVVASILPEIPKLTMAMNPIEWWNTTRRALHQVGLLCFLLDIKVIHPKPEDPDYKNWYEWSTTAYRWMYSNKEKDVQNIIDNMSD